MSRRALPAVAMLVILTAAPAFAYLKLGTRVGTRTLSLKWQNLPVRYFVTDRGVTGISSQQAQEAFARAFATWHAVDTAQTSSQFVGFTQAAPVLNDGVTVLGFVNRPDLERVLGATNFLIDTQTGEIVESDIFFNSTFPWSVTAAGETGRHDLQSIALHEIGHLLGVGHSALGETEIVSGGRRVLGAEAVMFPIAFSAGSIADRALKEDDIAAITDVYPTAASRRARGSISGKVTKNGQPVRGAHIVAFNQRTGALVGGFTLNDEGTFTIAGLLAGPHILRVEPLDDADTESFFDASFTVDLDFRLRFHDRVVVVPQGGGATGIDVKVTPK